LGGNVFGVIVNGLGATKSDYGYRYGYGSNQYSYGGYYGKQHKSYYEDDAKTKPAGAANGTEDSASTCGDDESKEASAESAPIAGRVSKMFRWLSGN